MFLRTEEKKREKERQSAAATPTPAVETPAPSEQPPVEAPVEQNGTADAVAQVPNAHQPEGEGEGEAEAVASDRAPIENAMAESKESDLVQIDGTEPAPLASEVLFHHPSSTFSNRLTSHPVRGYWPAQRNYRGHR